MTTNLHKKRMVSSIGSSLRKGIIHQPTNKIFKGTIPSKIQNVVSKKTSKSVQSIKTSKPLVELVNQAPESSSYQLSSQHSKVFSKKGSAAFASLPSEDRFKRSKSHTPGPGAYNKTGDLQSDYPSKIKKKVLLEKHHSLCRISKQKQGVSIEKNPPCKIYKMKEGMNDLLLVRQISSFLKKPQQTSENMFNPHMQMNITRAKKKSRLKINKRSTTTNIFKNTIERFKSKQNQTPPVGYYQANPQPIKKSNKPPIDKIITKHPLSFPFQIIFDEMSQKQKVGPGCYDPKLKTSVKGFRMRETCYDRFGDKYPLTQPEKFHGANLSSNAGVTRSRK